MPCVVAGFSPKFRVMALITSPDNLGERGVAPPKNSNIGIRVENKTDIEESRKSGLSSRLVWAIVF